MICIRGLAWIDEESYGSVRMNVQRDLQQDCETAGAPDGSEIFDYPVKNFGRFNRSAKTACYVSGLALHDAGIKYALGVKQDIGAIATNEVGCLSANEEYFRDYVECGRTMGRGNLFIYTLPSSPLAEVTIHFGLQGPMFFLLAPEGPLEAAVGTSADLIRAGEVSAMLVIGSEGASAVCFVVGTLDDADSSALCGMNQALDIVKGAADLKSVIHDFRQLN